MKVKEILAALEQFAPLPLQEDYDNAGLQIGLTEAEVSGALLCLDVTEQVVEEAASLGCNLIVSHHPLIFRGIKQLTGADYVQRTVMLALQKGIALISMHTNLDSAEEGVNYRIAAKLGLTDEQLISPRVVDGVSGGTGVLARFAEPMQAEDFLQKVKATFGVRALMCNELVRRPITTVAICGGAGSFLLADAQRLGADAFITGEMSYHQYFGTEQQIQIAVLGHYESEQYTIDLLSDILREKFPALRLEKTKVLTNPINVV